MQQNGAFLVSGPWLWLAAAAGPDVKRKGALTHEKIVGYCVVRSYAAQHGRLRQHCCIQRCIQRSSRFYR
jgi:hypothetical protein